MKKIILSVAILATCMTACKKKSDDPTPPTTTTTTKTDTQYLTAHSWKISGSVSDVAVDEDNNASTPVTKDLWSEYKTCEKDDYWIFLANGTGSFTDAGTVCSGNTSPTKNFTWTYTSNSVIVVSIPGNNGSIGLTLLSIDDNTLRLSLPSQQDPHGVAYIETDTYTK
jgi:hypothetical protein